MNGHTARLKVHGQDDISDGREQEIGFPGLSHDVYVIGAWCPHFREHAEVFTLIRDDFQPDELMIVISALRERVEHILGNAQFIAAPRLHVRNGVVTLKSDNPEVLMLSSASHLELRHGLRSGRPQPQPRSWCKPLLRKVRARIDPNLSAKAVRLRHHTHGVIRRHPSIRCPFWRSSTTIPSFTIISAPSNTLVQSSPGLTSTTVSTVMF